MYGIYSYAKVKGDSGGLATEHQRTTETDLTRMSSAIDGSRTRLNQHYGVWDYDEEARRLCSELNVKTRSNSILLLDHCVTFSPEAYPNFMYMMHNLTKSKQNKIWKATETGQAICEMVEQYKAEGKNIEEEVKREYAEMREYFDKSLAWIGNNMGTVISYDIHFDESTPHMHVVTVPLVQDNENDWDSWRLSAKELVGNKTKMRKTQTKFYEEVSSEFGFEQCKSTPERELVQQKLTNAEYWIDQYDRIAEDRQEEIQFLENDVERLGKEKEKIEIEFKKLGRETESAQREFERLGAAIEKNKGTLRQQRVEQATIVTDAAEKIRGLIDDGIEELNRARDKREREIIQNKTKRMLYDLDMGR